MVGDNGIERGIVITEETIDTMVGSGDDIGFLLRVGEARQKHTEYVKFLKSLGWSKLAPDDIKDPTGFWEEDFSTLLKHKEDTAIPQFVPRNLRGDERIAYIIDNSRPGQKPPLPVAFSGLSGRVTRTKLDDGQEVAVKMPNRESGMGYIDSAMDLQLEKRTLGRLRSLQGKGVVGLRGTINWYGEFGLVKGWVNGKTLGRELMPTFERNQSGLIQDTREAARLVLSAVDVMSEIHKRKVAVGDAKRADFIWDGRQTTLIDFAQSGLAVYDAREKRWRISNFPQGHNDFDQYVKEEELPAFLETTFFPFTSVGELIEGVSLKREKVESARDPLLREIGRKTIAGNYQNAFEVRRDLEEYFLSLGMSEVDLGMPLRIEIDNV